MPPKKESAKDPKAMKKRTVAKKPNARVDKQHSLELTFKLVSAHPSKENAAAGGVIYLSKPPPYPSRKIPVAGWVRVGEVGTSGLQGTLHLVEDEVAGKVR